MDREGRTLRGAHDASPPTLREKQEARCHPGYIVKIPKTNFKLAVYQKSYYCRSLWGRKTLRLLTPPSHPLRLQFHFWSVGEAPGCDGAGREMKKVWGSATGHVKVKAGWALGTRTGCLLLREERP